MRISLLALPRQPAATVSDPSPRTSLEWNVCTISGWDGWGWLSWEKRPNYLGTVQIKASRPSRGMESCPLPASSSSSVPGPQRGHSPCGPKSRGGPGTGEGGRSPWGSQVNQLLTALYTSLWQLGKKGLSQLQRQLQLRSSPELADTVVQPPAAPVVPCRPAVFTSPHTKHCKAGEANTSLKTASCEAGPGTTRMYSL